MLQWAVLLVIATSASWCAAAQDKPFKLATEFIGCWQINDTASQSRRDFCLGKDGKVNAGWTNSEEGMYSSGTYRIKGTELTVYGTDGNGGPPRSEVVNHCKFALVFNRDELLLRDCTFAGDWKRLCRDLKTDEHSVQACVRYPAN
jgi:hypothetical protein